MEQELPFPQALNATEDLRNELCLDLRLRVLPAVVLTENETKALNAAYAGDLELLRAVVEIESTVLDVHDRHGKGVLHEAVRGKQEIGRASCRERVCQYV